MVTPYDIFTREEMEAFWRSEENKAYTSTANKGTGNIRETNKMGETIKQAAQNYVPQTTKNIADLPEVNIEAMQLEDRESKDNEGIAFKYKVVIVNGEEYRVPGSVIGSIKGILDKKPTLKRISVSKQGTGMLTRYTVIPLE